MGIINLLHISDSHINCKGKEEISEITQKLCEDVLKVQKEKGVTIDVICFSGDLIQSGAEAMEGEKQWELAREILIKPLIEKLELDEKDVLLTPGNHEVNTQKIEKMVESGLSIYIVWMLLAISWVLSTNCMFNGWTIFMNM